MKTKRHDWTKSVPWIALIIAVYGAGLSTLQLHDSRAEKARRVEVSLIYGGVIAKGVIHQKALAVTVWNPSYQEVAIAAAGILLPDGGRIYVLDPKAPTRVPPGDNLQGRWAGQDLVRFCDIIAAKGFNGEVTLVGFCQDGLGAFHNSAPLQFNAEGARRDALTQANSPQLQKHNQQ